MIFDTKEQCPVDCSVRYLEEGTSVARIAEDCQKRIADQSDMATRQGRVKKRKKKKNR